MQVLVTKHRSRRARRGVALLYALFGAMAAASTVALFLALALSSDRTAGVHRHGTRARYAAEGGLESAKSELRTVVANWGVPAPTRTITLDGIDVTTSVQPSGFADVRTDPAGIQTTVTGFELDARAEVQGHRAAAHRVIEAEATPLFQFAVFYQGDLEINPGPDMTLTGRIHSNQDVFLNCGGTLRCDTNYLHAGGGIYRHRKDDPSQSGGTVDVRRWVANPFDPSSPVEFVRMNSRSQMDALGVPSISGYDSQFVDGWDAENDGDFYGPYDWLPFGPGALELWSEPDGYTGGTGNTVLTGEHGIGEAVTPDIGSIEMYEPVDGGSWAWDNAAGEYVPVAAGTGTHDPGYYHGQAGLAIRADANGTWKAFDGTGADVTSALQSCGAVTVGDIYDARQANGGVGNVPLIEIDVERLGSCSAWPSNGLLYAGHQEMGTGTEARGVLLKHGSELASKLTVVSDGSVYIQGDYNTVAKKGAAVIGDAINLLSNAWNDSKTAANGLPTASRTTYNCAMLTGNSDSSVGSYNGGLENLPRFHENWSGVDCVIAGSFVNLWNSVYATGAWVYGGNRYQAPRRLWNYDPAFNQVANLPPFTPMAVTAVDVVSW
jgi:hypothetical protein